MPELLDPPAPELTIQEMAARSGLSEYTLRYYERIGLIEPISRDRSSGHRRYSPAMAVTVENLACLRATGMPLEAMRRYLRFREQGNAAAAEQKQLFAAQKAVLERESQLLQTRIAYLAAKVEFWEARENGDEETLTRLAAVMPDLIRRLNESGNK